MTGINHATTGGTASTATTVTAPTGLPEPATRTPNEFTYESKHPLLARVKNGAIGAIGGALGGMLLLSPFAVSGGIPDLLATGVVVTTTLAGAYLLGRRDPAAVAHDSFLDRERTLDKEFLKTSGAATFQHAAQLVARFDVDASGTIELDGGERSYVTHKDGGLYALKVDTWAAGHIWDAANANGDDVVTQLEVALLMNRFDENHDGRMSTTERDAFDSAFPVHRTRS